MNDNHRERRANPFDKTNLSRLNHLEFLGLALRNLVVEIKVCMHDRLRNEKLLHTAKKEHERLGPYPEAHLNSWNFIGIWILLS